MAGWTTLVLGLLTALSCGGGEGKDDAGEAVTDAALPDARDPSGDAAHAGDASPADAGGPSGYVPASAACELIASGPARVSTPATWNAHLPKLVGDAHYLYAVHTHFPGDVASRYAAIMRRPAGAPGAGWTEVARVSYVHQPPGLVMDASARMHMIFDCLRPAGAAVTCFQGGAGTGALTSRFYHLVFSARDAQSALRFDTYANHDEWTVESNGYQGIGTTSDGVTFWSLANSSWQRVVQMWQPSGWSTIDTLERPDAYLLYPIMAAPALAGSDSLLLYAGEFDPGGGNTSSYLASTAYLGDADGLELLFRRSPPEPPTPGTTAAYPSDLAFDADDTLFALSYLPDGEGGCTEILRFDAGLGSAPAIIPVGCVSNYAKLQFAADGTLYLLSSGAGQSARLGVSIDRGDSFSWHDVALAGLPANGDTRYFGFTVVKPYTSPDLYDPDRLTFFFAGADSENQAQHSYFGTIALVP